MASASTSNREDLLQMAKEKAYREALIEQAKAKMMGAPAEGIAPIDDSNLGGQYETGVRGVLNSLSLGVSEPLMSGANALVGKALDEYLRQKEISEGIPQADAPTISDLYKQDVERIRGLKEKFPATDIGAQVAGALAPWGAGAQAFKVAGKLAKGSGLGEAMLAKFGPKVAEKVASGAALSGGEKLAQIASTASVEGLGAGMGALGSGVVQKAALEPSGFIKEGESPGLVEQTLSGAKFGSVIGAAPGVYRLAKDVTKSQAKKALAILGGVKEDTISDYLKNRDRILAAPSLEQTVDEINTVVAGLKEKVSDARVTKAQADEALKAIESDIKLNYREQGLDLKEIMSSAKEQVRLAHQEQMDALRRVRPPQELISDIQESLQTSKKTLIENSKEANALLENSSKTFAVKPIIDRVASEMESMTMYGQVMRDESAYNELAKLKDKLEKFPDTINMREAKKILDSLDDKIDYSYGSASFNPALNQALKPIRGEMRETIGKIVKGYNDILSEKVIPIAQNHERWVDTFGDTKTLPAKLANIFKPNNAQNLEDIQLLGALSGKDYTGQLEKFRQAQEVLGSKPMQEKLLANLPQSKALSQVEAVAAQRLRDNSAQQIQSIVDQTSQARIAQEAAQKVKLAEDVFEPFKMFTEMNGMNRAKQVIRGTNPVVTERLGKLSKMTDKDFIQNIKDADTLSQFSHEFRIGMRNVGLWGALGALSGSAGIDDPMGIGKDAAMGAVIGGIVDRYGPRMTKKILDGVVQINGVPTIQKIQKLDLPPAAKQYLIDDLARVLQKREMLESTVISNQAERIGLKKELKASANFTPTEKAKIISKLNKTGEFDQMNKLLGIEAKPQQSLSNENKLGDWVSATKESF